MKHVMAAIAIVAAVALAGCGKGSSSSSNTTTNPVTITIAPTSAFVATGQTAQFAASVTNNSNTAVTWQVNGTTGGNSTVGTISSVGTYVAPATVPSPATVTVTVISQADTTKSASAQVTITPGTSAAVNPAATVVSAAGQVTFTATANGNPVAVTWSLTCHSSVAGACGTITAAGVYTAPLSPPPGGDVLLTATTTDGSALPGGASITVQFSKGTLRGQYAFTFSGQNAGNFFAAAGSISFDGSGNITGGTEDINSGGASSVTITGGTYNVGTDGRVNASVQTSNGTQAWQLALVNHSRALAIRFDNNIPASGTFDLQDSSAFSLSAVQGSYALRVSGINAQPTPRSFASVGAVSANGSGVLSSGLLDINNGGTASSNLSVTGSYTAPGTGGRGTLTLSSSFGTQTFAYYVVDATRWKLVETDASLVTAGESQKQVIGPFTTASFARSFAFLLSGASSQGPLGQGGLFQLDGAGNVKNVQFDLNNNGNTQSNASVSGTYSVTDAATGRTTMTITVNNTPLQYVLYPQTANALNVVEVDATYLTSGIALPQSGTFSSGTFQGNYAASFTGTDLTVSPGELDISGQLVPNGGSAVAGTLDINDNGATSSGAPVNGSYLGISSTGRGTASLSSSAAALKTAGFFLYLVDSNTALFLESDSNRVLTGTVQKQY